MQGEYYEKSEKGIRTWNQLSINYSNLKWLHHGKWSYQE